MALSIIFVVVFIILGVLDRKSLKIYDDISKYTMRENSYSYLKRDSQSKEDELEMSFKLFDGIDTVYKSDLEEGEDLTILYTIDLIQGRFKLIAIDEEDKVIEIHEGKGGGEYELDLPEGEVRLRILGDRAEGFFKFKIKE